MKRERIVLDLEEATKVESLWESLRAPENFDFDIDKQKDYISTS